VSSKNARSAPSGPATPSDAQLARLMERAASHQTRALAWVRQARDPSAGPLRTSQRRDLLIRALEHLLAARRLLERVQETSASLELLTVLNSHLARLESTVANVERLLQDLDAAAER